MRRRWLQTEVLCGLILAVLALTGCRADRSGPTADTFWIPVQVLFSSSQCEPTAHGPTAEWVAAHDLRPLRLRKSLDATVPLDPSREAVLRIHMGQRPTAGYSLRLTSPRAAVQQGVATIALEWGAPAPGAYVAQIRTSPCLIVTFPKTRLDTVQIRDQHGGIRFSLAIP